MTAKERKKIPLMRMKMLMCTYSLAFTLLLSQRTKKEGKIQHVVSRSQLATRSQMNLAS